ncbi:hypothetical protein CLOM_g1206 [Closterium sp. NIES-68]|nr:hypothetical protein CLOM_g20224 [Closterium sp. NIES-68]GJP41541.1 hypothetical protein CLOM_g1206 [Closterium sp. NIES-68]GJP65317.1 hypothetical protein CLOP_g22217 [Closterium sp. NIES-67]
MASDLLAEAKEAIKQMLQDHKKTFAYSIRDLDRCNLRQLELNLTTEVPIYQCRRRLSPGDEEICRAKCKELLDAEVIRPSESPYAAAIVVAARTDLAGTVLQRRMCGDYRDLNRVTVPDRYTMPTAEEIFDRLANARLISTFDLRQGFNQIAIREQDKKKTAFYGADGLYEWNTMPFGLRNALAVFQRTMDQGLRDVPNAACYINDVIAFSSSEDEHT